MHITRVTLYNIRTHSEISVAIDPHTTAIVGKNGAGKTSIIEAIHLALRGTSFKGTDTELLKFGAPWWRIILETSDETTRNITFEPENLRKKKQFRIHSQQTARLAEKHKYPVVLFEPDDLRLLTGSPLRRREFVDRLILQIDPLYASILRKYERALKQRNNLLKHDNARPQDFFVWNVALSEYGASIIQKRIYMIEKINQIITDRYRAIADTDDTISTHYSHTLIDYSAQKLLHEIEASFEKDRVAKHTNTGPHRHDVLFTLNNKPMLSVASRGEIRTTILAIKQIETDLIIEMTGNTPILLLDDVLSELDEFRKSKVTFGSEGQQTIITDTKGHSGAKIVSI